MFDYPHQQLRDLCAAILREHLAHESFEWLKAECAAVSSGTAINRSFMLLPRKTGKRHINLSPLHLAELRTLRPGTTFEGWQSDRLGRVWMLTQVEPRGQEQYQNQIEGLFYAADMNELVALYSALPFLAYPPIWKGRCSEGIRNNISDVLEAVMYDNPYPAEQLPEPAWNQLVLKAVFTEKKVSRIWGLDRRRNAALASTLNDYAHERWAAGRSVNPQLWRCVAPFVSANMHADIQRLFDEGTAHEKAAAALVCHENDSPAARAMLNRHPELQHDIASGELSWQTLAHQIDNHVLQP